MSAMRRSMALVGVLLLAGCQDDPPAEPAAKQPKVPPKVFAEPTAEQLKAAQEAFAKIGARYEAGTNPLTKKTVHVFRMSRDTTDAELKRLPNPPFSFALDLSGTQVTDVGLKELKNLKGLTTPPFRSGRAPSWPSA